MTALNRRTALAGAAALTLGSAVRDAFGQDKPKAKFSAAFTDQDLRAEAYKAFAQEMKDDLDIEFFLNNTLFKQGTELVAMQRGNLEMCNLAPADISKQVPAWSLLTSAYLFRDADHLKKTFKSDVGQEMNKLAREKLGIQLIAPVYFGTRQVNLKPAKKITTPADMAGMKLRMPPGEFWQFLGESIGANPTPVAFAEVYTALQSGAIDGQDNPLPNVQNMKFYEVMSQIVLTSHLIGFDLLCVSSKVWSGMTPAQQQKFQAAADKAIDWSANEHLKQEAELVEFLKKQGLQIYAPDIKAFRENAQKIYLASDQAKSWPAGMLDKINAL